MQALPSRLHGEIAQLVEHTTENRGVPGSSPGLAILKPEIPLGCGIFCSVVQSPLELPAPRAEIVVVWYEDAAANWLGYGRARSLSVDAIRVQVGPHRLFVAFFLRPLEGSGVSASDSSDALATACLPTAADKRVVVRAGVQAVCDAAERRFPSRGGVGVGVLVTTGSRPTRARRPAHHACSLRHRCRRRLSDTYRRRDVANRVPNGCGVDATARPRPASFSLTARSTSPRIRRGEPSGARSHARSRCGVRPGKGILGRAGCALPLVAEDR